MDQGSHLHQRAARWTGEGRGEVRRLARLLGVDADDVEKFVTDTDFLRVLAGVLAAGTLWNPFEFKKGIPTTSLNSPKVFATRASGRLFVLEFACAWQSGAWNLFLPPSAANP